MQRNFQKPTVQIPTQEETDGDADLDAIEFDLNTTTWSQLLGSSTAARAGGDFEQFAGKLSPLHQER